MLNDLGFRFLALFRKDSMEDDLEDELQFHLQRLTQQYIAAGVSPREALRRARMQLGGMEQVKEETRQSWGVDLIDSGVRDIAHALRILRKTPAFTVSAVLSLALGIGAVTTIYGLMDRVMFRPLPVPHPERLVELDPEGISHPMLQELRQVSSFEGVFGRSVRTLGPVGISMDGKREMVNLELVSGGYFPVLGIQPQIGRGFTQSPNGGDARTPEAVLSYRYWTRRFSGNSSVIGKTLRILDTSFTIIGVTGESFYGTMAGQEPDITVPLSLDAQVRGKDSCLDQFGCWWVGVMARLKPGRTIEQAMAEIDALQSPGMKDYRASMTLPRFRLHLASAENGFSRLRARFEQPLLILMGTVSLVLLLVCFNVANLLLARSLNRQSEFALRLAIGAGRGRIVRQFLTESLLLAFAGGIVGIGLAPVFADVLVTMMSNGGPRILVDVTPDVRVLIFALAVTVSSTLIFGLVPAFRVARHSLRPALAESRTAQWRLGRGFLSAQMAICVLLLIGAGLFVRTLNNIYAEQTGFDASGVVLFSTNLGTLGYPNDKAQDLEQRALEELRALPGVKEASLSKYPPVNGRGSWRQRMLMDSQEILADPPHLNSVAASYFTTYGTPILLGREFTDRDTEISPRVVIVNERFAREHFARTNPVGRRLALANEPKTFYEIVGVVKDVKYETVRSESPPTVYFAASQVPPGDSHTFALRTPLAPSSLARALSVALERVDPLLRVQNLRTLTDHVERSVLEERMLATLGAFFGMVALLLGTIGIYGMVAYQVSLRRKEIGIRIALGATSRSVLGMMLRLILAPTLVGCGIGTGLGLILTRRVRAFLFDIAPTDPLTFGLAISCLLLAAMAAAFIPGRGAARIDPTETMKS